MDTLFTDLPEQLSPRLAWMRLHRVNVAHYPQFNGQDEDEFGNRLFPYQAYVDDANKEAIGGNNATGAGMSEWDACVDLSLKQGWPMWNQEV